MSVLNGACAIDCTPATTDHEPDCQVQQNFSAASQIECAVSEKTKSRSPELNVFFSNGMHCKARAKYEWKPKEYNVEQHILFAGVWSRWLQVTTSRPLRPWDDAHFCEIEQLAKRKR
jgi:hypothetical protein